MYIEKAHPLVQEYAKIRGWEFVKDYETNAEFREFVDLLAVAPKEKVEEVKAILIAGQKRAKGQATE